MWSKRGFCHDAFQSTSMKILCPRSCSLCPGPASPFKNLKPVITSCADTASYLTCKIVVIFDECDTKKDLCAETCGLC